MHQPVMLNEVIEALNPQPGNIFIDATLGGGGHTQALIDRGAKVFGLDQDPLALGLIRQAGLPQGLTLLEGNFSHLTDLITPWALSQIHGILFDLGTSAMQLNDDQRGFSFQADAPLDMRMSPELGVTAADLVNALSKNELAQLFSRFAQERRSHSLASAIVRSRQLQPIKTTGDLVKVIEDNSGPRTGKLHPATKIFQALRIAVNDELNNLISALPQAVTLLSPGGRLAVISFHEGEDRIVKRYFREQARLGTITILTPKPLRPTGSEIKCNPRARSARLRIAQKN